MIKLQASQLPRSALVDSHSQCRASFRGRVIVRASNEGDSPISEDLIQRLKSAEEEAQRLRQELAAAKAVSSGSESDEAPAAPAVKPPRIDGADLRRETLSFVGELFLFIYRIFCIYWVVTNTKFLKETPCI